MAKPSRRAASSNPSQRPATLPVNSGPDELNTRERPLTPQEVRQQRSSYVDAVAIYEQALRTLQQHNFAKAAELLRHVVSGFPEERELLERARLYLNLCERHLHPPAAEPGDTSERLYAATLSLNAGAPDRAIDFLNHVLADDPSNDQALYMLAVAHAERGEPAVAIPYLKQAIAANPENRSLARVDPDLDGLRAEEGIGPLLDLPGTRFGGAGARSVRRP
jgi:tetratricopeptide (TPR) repeat protein